VPEGGLMNSEGDRSLPRGTPISNSQTLVGGNCPVHQRNVDLVKKLDADPYRTEA
jgi:hypothetical protein